MVQRPRSRFGLLPLGYCCSHRRESPRCRLSNLVARTHILTGFFTRRGLTAHRSHSKPVLAPASGSSSRFRAPGGPGRQSSSRDSTALSQPTTGQARALDPLLVSSYSSRLDSSSTTSSYISLSRTLPKTRQRLYDTQRSSVELNQRGKPSATAWSRSRSLAVLAASTSTLACGPLLLCRLGLSSVTLELPRRKRRLVTFQMVTTRASRLNLASRFLGSDGRI